MYDTKGFFKKMKIEYKMLKKIISGAAWDVEVRSPLVKPGVNVKEGDYILAVNGLKVDASKPIAAAFQGLAKAKVQLTVNASPSFSKARKVIIKTMSSSTVTKSMSPSSFSFSSHLVWLILILPGNYSSFLVTEG